MREGNSLDGSEGRVVQETRGVLWFVLTIVV